MTDLNKEYEELKEQIKNDELTLGEVVLKLNDLMKESIEMQGIPKFPKGSIVSNNTGNETIVPQYRHKELEGKTIVVNKIGSIKLDEDSPFKDLLDE